MTDRKNNFAFFKDNTKLYETTPDANCNFQIDQRTVDTVDEEDYQTFAEAWMEEYSYNCPLA